jgi:hypothetical protein
MVSEDTCRGAFDGVFSEQVPEHLGLVWSSTVALCISVSKAS